MQEPPLFSLLYTTVRPPSVPKVCNMWLTKAFKTARVEMVIATDFGDDAALNAVTLTSENLTQHRIFSVITDPHGDCVKGWNAAAKYSEGQILIQISDDFEPPTNWDSLLINLSCKHGGKWWEHDHAVHVNNLFVPHIMTLAIITRVRYSRYGYFYYPGYKSMFCDTELTEVAYRDGVVIDAKHLTFEHHHYNRNHRECDTVDKKHGSEERWKQGEDLFNSRKAANFPADVAVHAS